MNVSFKIIIIMIIEIFIFGCTNSKVIHTFEITATNRDGIPLKNIELKGKGVEFYKGLSYVSTVKSNEFNFNLKTDDSGKAILSRAKHFINIYNTKFTTQITEISVDGYHSKNVKFEEIEGKCYNTDYNKKETKKIRIVFLENYDAEGYDENGYNISGYNRLGYDENGYNREGYDKEGYDKNGYDKEGYDKEGYDKNGYDKEGYNKNGWNKDLINKKTGTKYDENGYNEKGYNIEGYDKNGYNENGYNKLGYNINGYDKEGWNKNGYNIEGYDKEGYTDNGWSKEGYDKKRNGFHSNKGIDLEVVHTFDIAITDIDGVPFKDIELNGTINSSNSDDYTSTVKDFSIKSDQNGKVKIIFTTNYIKPKYYSVSWDDSSSLNRTTHLTYIKIPEINHNGYYKATKLEFKIDGDYAPKDTKNKKNESQIILYKPDDYFKKEFLSEKRFIDLRSKVKELLDLIKLQTWAKDAKLPYRSIGIYEFKNKKYIEVNIESTVSYNSLKSNKYDIGKNLYGELVVKVLDYLVMIEDKNLSGVNLRVTGYTKDFGDKYGSSTPIKYDFIMNKETIRKYKDKDITSQKLLDESVILMDNERIELRLQ